MRIHAAGVNFPDVLLIANSYQVSIPPPFVPGSEFAGTIDEGGSDTTGFATGDRVTGTGMFGAFAERVVVDAATLARIPDGIDEPTAVAFGVAYRTAYHTLRSAARLATNAAAAVGTGGAATDRGRGEGRSRLLGRIGCERCDRVAATRAGVGVRGRAP